MNVEDVKRKCALLLESMDEVIIGKDEVQKKLIITMLAGGHVLMEDFPGLAKTLMAKSFSQVLGLNFKRIQFTPDLLPADITGSHVLDPKTGEFRLRKGPIFSNILLADEINRAPPKTQSALLEAMEEKQTTLDGTEHGLPQPFMVIATQNPIEYEGTYPLPEAQVDRFLVKMEVGYPEEGEEAEILRIRKKRKKDATFLQPVLKPEEIAEMRKVVENVHLDDDLYDYIVKIVGLTRKDHLVEVGASPRGSLALMKLSSARAATLGRDYVTPDDVKYVAKVGLAHRIILRPDPWIRGVRPAKVLENVLSQVPVPKVKD